MSDALLAYIRQTLPAELENALSERLAELERGDFAGLFSLPLVRTLVGHEDDEKTRGIRFRDFGSSWDDYIFDRLGALLAKRTEGSDDGLDTPLYRQYLLFLVAVAALQAFTQSNITGPPLPFRTAEVLIADDVYEGGHGITEVRRNIVKSLSVDGEAAYKLTPNVELLSLADTILICPPIKKNIKAQEWATLRKNFIHQRILSAVSPKLQESIYEGLDAVDVIFAEQSSVVEIETLLSSYLLEKAAIHTHHGLDKQARDVLEDVSKRRKFEFALTGRLGKRTKYQENDTSQLVVLAKSNTHVADEIESRAGPGESDPQNRGSFASRPENLNLDDDTLLESISFSENLTSSPSVKNETQLPDSLASIDPGKQPLLEPLDSIILLSLALSITNTSPSDGLTREQTLPYALRVLEGGSSNWQVYTQALLVRSRAEAYHSRTTERGLLQLQTLVDQVIADTSPDGSRAQGITSNDNSGTFLPRAKESESASVGERLLYVYQLSPPLRWDLEAELAARWISLGGVRSALEIYERLEMWAEAALCWAATDREDKAKKIVRRQLFHASVGRDEDANPDEEPWTGPPIEPSPLDAPRLYCILGDLDNDIGMYEKAWDISNGRYARAQRSIGRLQFSRSKFVESAAAYSKSLKINHLNENSWFVLGCSLLNLGEFDKAVEAFTRTVQLDDRNAEAWSNLATGLLSKDRVLNGKESNSGDDFDAIAATEDNETEKSFRRDPQQNSKDALKALKRAAAIDRENFRIWDNLLTVAASLEPPAYTDVINAQTRVIELRGPVEGEKCIDVKILELLVRHVVSHSPPADLTPEPTQAETDGQTSELRGLPRIVVSIFDTHIIPLITSSARLWRLVSTLALWRNNIDEALAAQEKAWRTVFNSVPDLSSSDESTWQEVVEATVELCDAYENLGGQLTEKGEPVVKDWTFKSRSALRVVLGKAKEAWEGTEGWDMLQERLQRVKRGTS